MTCVTGPQGQTSYGYNLDNTRSVELTVTPDLGQVGTLYTYAATGILSEIKTMDLNAVTVLSQTNYTYYMDGNVHTETDLPANTTATYTYDDAGRLKTEVSSAGSYSYTYDAAGNRATMTENGATTTYTYDKNNRLLTETKPGSVKSYTYDANGNMLTGDGATYTYDARDRQSGYVKDSAAASYTYYPTGLRKTKTANLAITTYVWDGSNMVLEYTGSASAGKVYIYGLTLISQENSLYYIYNGHGDVVKYINSTGAVLKSYDYDAFGEEVNASATDANPFRYAGQYFDSETGTYYLRARYYSPALGRFSQQDAWDYGDPGDPLSLNLYVYCYGNPLMFVDINGHWPTWSQIGTALLIGVAAVATAAAVVATAGAAGAAIGAAAGVYLGVSASTAAAITTAATGAAYVVAGANIVVGANDIHEVFTGRNIIRDDLMGGNQALYDDAKMALAIGSASFIQIALASGLIGPMGEPYKGPRNPSQDFVKGKRLKLHLTDHAGDFGIGDEDDYVKAAEHLLTKKPTSTTSSFVTEYGTYFRYDSATNEFGIMNQYGGISTYFKPRTGLEYWQDQINKYYYK